MPITDPVPDEAIVEGFKSLRDHPIDDSEGHAHGHTHHHPKPTPPPRFLFENEEPTDQIHEASLPTASTGSYQDAKNEHTKIVYERNEVEFISSTQKTQGHHQPTPTSPILSPFPDVDIFLRNDSQPPHQPPHSVPIQSAGARRSIIEILPTSQHRETASVDKKPDSGSKTMTMPNKHSDEVASGEKLFMTSTKKGDGGMTGLSERKYVAQWVPPPDTGNNHNVDAYEKFGRDNGVLGGGGGEGGVPIEQGRRKGVTTWFRPSVWLNHKLYKVSLTLSADWRVQASFFAKVILTKAAQLLIINLWILLVALLPEVQDFVVKYHNWMFLPLGLFLLILILVRIISKSKAGWYPLLPLSVLILLTLMIAYALAAVTLTYSAYCIPMITVTLFLTCVTLPFVPYMTQSAVTKPVVTRIGGVLVLIYAVFILVVAAYSQQIQEMTQFATLVWFPGLLMAEIVLWVTIYEIQRVLKGLCFNVTERRWCFTALYV